MTDEPTISQRWASLSTRVRVFIAVSAVGIAITGGVLAQQVVSHNRQMSAATSVCVAARERYASFERRSGRFASNDGVDAMMSVTDAQVTDDKLLSTFHAARDAFVNYHPRSFNCETGDMGNLRRTTGSIDGILNKRTAERARVLHAARLIAQSRDAKTLSDAKKALSEETTRARNMLDASDGTAADDATLVKLRRDIEAAESLLAGKVTDPAKYRRLQSSLTESEKAVNDSEKRNAAAAAEAAAAPSASGTAQDVQNASGQAPSQLAPMRQTAPGSASANTGASNQRFSPQLPAASSPSFGGSAPLDNSQDGMASRCKVFGEQAACDALSGN